jgi:hypothetical protein
VVQPCPPTLRELGSRSRSSNRLGDSTTRVIGVEERVGIVWLRMAWGVRESGGDPLTVWEACKIWDGQTHAVEAFMNILQRRCATVAVNSLASADGRIGEKW